MLLALHCLINIHRKHDLGICAAQLGKLHKDLLIIAVPGTGKIVAHVMYRTGLMGQVTEIYYVHRTVELSGLRAYEECGSVAVDILMS